MKKETAKSILFALALFLSLLAIIIGLSPDEDRFISGLLVAIPAAISLFIALVW
jgi:hypothetical protein